MKRTTTYGGRRSLTHLTALAAGSLLALSLTACGAASSLTGDDEDAKMHEAGLKYAKCMREHDIPMEDPTGDGGDINLPEGVDPYSESFLAAEKACHHILDDAMPDDAGGEVPAEVKDALLAAAKCMRERGWNYQDPKFDGNKIDARPGPDVDESDPSFQQDMDECNDESGVNDLEGDD